MRSYHKHRAWQAIADRATVPYNVFRFRVADGWDVITAATTPKRAHVNIVRRLYEVVAAAPWIRTDVLAKQLGVTVRALHDSVARECKRGRLLRMPVDNALGTRAKVYVVQIVDKPASAVAATAPPVRRRPEGLVYGRGY